MRARRVFITGTDTGVGKTWVACWLANQLTQAGLRVGAYKPVCSGAVTTATGPIWDDVERLYEALDRAFPRQWICPQTFVAPLAPPHAARMEKRMVDQGQMTEGAELWEGHVDVLLIEGAGGWLSPIADGMTNGDFAKAMGARVLIVAQNRLGVINHTRLTAESVRHSGVKLVGVILNHISSESRESESPDIEFARRNIQEIEQTVGKEPGPEVIAALPLESFARLALPVKVDWRQLLKV